MIPTTATPSNESLFDQMVRKYSTDDKTISESSKHNPDVTVQTSVKDGSEFVNNVTESVEGVGKIFEHDYSRNTSDLNNTIGTASAVLGTVVNANEFFTGRNSQGEEINAFERGRACAGTVKGVTNTIKGIGDNSIVKEWNTNRKMYNYVKADGRHTWASAGRKFKTTEVITMSKKVASGFGVAQALIAGVDFVFNDILQPNFGIENPIDHWMRKPFSGDWDKMNDAIEKWSQIAAELSVVRDYYANMYASVSTPDSGWKGASADAFACKRSEYDKPLNDFIDACDKVGAGTIASAKLAEECFDTTFSAVCCILNIAAEVSVEAAVPVIGWGALLLRIVPLAMDAISSVLDIIEAITDYYTAVSNYQQVVIESQAVITQIRGI